MLNFTSYKLQKLQLVALTNLNHNSDKKKMEQTNKQHSSQQHFSNFKLIRF